MQERSSRAAGTIDRTVWLEAPWGDVVVVAGDGPSPPSAAELLALAASVQPTDEATWDAFVVRANGGPGLHAAAPGTAVRADTGTEVVTAPLVAIPGSELRSAVLSLDQPARPDCADPALGQPAPPVGDGTMRLEVLDAEGRPTACIGGI